MNQSQASAAIFKRWINAWPGTASAAVAHSFDNVAAPVGALPRVAVNIVSLDAEQETLGPRAKVRRDGMIDVRIYGAIGVGRGELDAIADDVKIVFERRSIGADGNPAPGSNNRVVTHAATINELRRDRDSGGLWMLSVTIPFEFREVRSGF